MLQLRLAASQRGRKATAPLSRLRVKSRKQRLALSLCLAWLLGACSLLSRPEPLTSHPPELPLLKLAPASLGQNLALHQRLSVEQQGQPQPALEVLLQIDSRQLKLAAMSLGFSVLQLQFDGSQLQQQRHPLLPAQVDAQRILRDLMLTYWPLPVLQQALGPDWQLQQNGPHRRFSWRNQPVLQIQYPGPNPWHGRIELDNLSQHYRLQIDSIPL